MAFVVYGAGAIGGLLGGSLARAGEDTVLIARGANLAAIRENGLRMEIAGRTETVRVRTAEDPASAGLRAGDTVILAMKSQDTPAAVEALADAAPPGIAVVCAQNGVENERLALRHFAEVYGMCVLCPATHLEPGAVSAFTEPYYGVFDLGRYPHGGDGTAERIAEAVTASGALSRVRPDIMRLKYTKLLGNLANAVEAAFGADAHGELDADAARLRRLAEDEGRAVLAAIGVDPLPAEEFWADYAALTRTEPRPDAATRGSTWQSLRRGAGRAEGDYLNGEIALLGRLHGVPTPVNAELQRLTRRLARTGAAPGSASAAEVLARAGA
ncbi:ketopantoate reductase family protein [Allonocardiopsis opalescens]|uniref:2-dehydropantoate 2-reductase n=1 Tax=Allonocardiopsis opalescens TaxID=1144618 RepID=A0A2T0Q7P4_9ACTN|nr:2-dehydropantoate 2-reductase [Allonocardiopsis opalescens]PRX99857.1 ketopantoate reductase [Allonocardiopsis opalescens]